jgi:1,4-alpha-glucan branching enzyme
MIDCRLLSDADGSFTDLSQSVNYVTSHDVGGFGNERLYTFLGNNGIVEREQRVKLAFACLFTAVGIPMIFAGEEFADDHDLPPTDSAKQVDPVNFDRLVGPENEFRRRILAYVARLVRLRTTSDALTVNDTRLLHVDFEEGKRVLVWQRGPDGGDAQVLVVANFSDWGTADPTNPSSVYVIPNFPPTPPGRRWREVTQERDVPAEWIGKEPIYPWEAKVYALA